MIRTDIARAGPCIGVALVIYNVGVTFYGGDFIRAVFLLIKFNARAVGSITLPDNVYFKGGLLA